MQIANKPMAHIITTSCVTVYYEGETPRSFMTSQVDTTKLVNAINHQDWDTVREQVDTLAAIRNKFRGYADIEVTDTQVCYKGQPVHNSLSKRILNIAKNGGNPEALVKFLANLMQNPSQRAINELYRFLECNDLPLTNDGHFLAYKRVRENYRDVWSGQIDNSIGQIVVMERSAVMDDPNQTCSAGLHFCSFGYLRSFNGSHLMVLKINPRDVVSIPVDYNNSKGRCCRYEVVDELDISIIDNHADVLSDGTFIWDAEEDPADYEDQHDEPELESDEPESEPEPEASLRIRIEYMQKQFAVPHIVDFKID